MGSQIQPAFQEVPFTPSLLRWASAGLSNFEATFSIDGTDHTADIRQDSVASWILVDEQLSTCSLRANAPVGVCAGDGEEIIITVGPTRVFAGTVTDVHRASPDNRDQDLSCYIGCVDYTRLFNRRTVMKHYAQQSATDIITDIITTFTSGFTSVNVVAGLPTVTGGIDFTDETPMRAVTRVMKRVGGYAYIDYRKDVHAFLTESSDAPFDVDDANPSATVRNLTEEKDPRSDADARQCRGPGIDRRRAGGEHRNDGATREHRSLRGERVESGACRVAAVLVHRQIRAG